MKTHKEKMDRVVIIEKVLHSIKSKFDYVICSMEECNDLNVLTIDELQSNMLVHKQIMNSYNGRDKQALKISHKEKVW